MCDHDRIKQLPEPRKKTARDDIDAALDLIRDILKILPPATAPMLALSDISGVHHLNA